MTDREVLLETYSQLVAIKRVLIALLIVVALFGATALFESSRDRSEQKANEQVECLLSENC